MKNTKHSSGNWGPNQEKLLGDLLWSNTIDYRNRSGEYLFAVSEEHFPNFQSSACETSLLLTNKTCSLEELKVSLVMCIDTSSKKKPIVVFCPKNPQPPKVVTKTKPKKWQLSPPQSRLPALPLLPSWALRRKPGSLKKWWDLSPHHQQFLAGGLGWEILKHWQGSPPTVVSRLF